MVVFLGLYLSRHQGRLSVGSYRYPVCPATYVRDKKGFHSSHSRHIQCPVDLLPFCPVPSGRDGGGREDLAVLTVPRSTSVGRIVPFEVLSEKEID